MEWMRPDRKKNHDAVPDGATGSGDVSEDIMRECIAF